MITPDPLADRRTHRRYQLSTDISVFNQMNQEDLGQLVNLHHEGLMLMGKPLVLHSTYQVVLPLPNCIHQQQEIILGIECLWTQQVDKELNLFWTGCAIIDKSSEAKACIETLINIQS